jgi:hypothetical protein
MHDPVAGHRERPSTRTASPAERRESCESALQNCLPTRPRSSHQNFHRRESRERDRATPAMSPLASGVSWNRVIGGPLT